MIITARYLFEEGKQRNQNLNSSSYKKVACLEVSQTTVKRAYSMLKSYRLNIRQVRNDAAITMLL